MAERSPYVEVNFRPNVDLIGVVRRFVADFYQDVLEDQSAAARIVLATHELLENAVKYSLDGETTIRITISQDEAGQKMISIRTGNRASGVHIEAVKTMFAEMRNEASDAFSFYQTVMRRNARAPDRSGLGLARIHAEADMTLDYELNDDFLTILAEAKVQGRQAA